jgi:hypothetical protein
MFNTVPCSWSTGKKNYFTVFTWPFSTSFYCVNHGLEVLEPSFSICRQEHGYSLFVFFSSANNNECGHTVCKFNICIYSVKFHLHLVLSVRSFGREVINVPFSVKIIFCHIVYSAYFHDLIKCEPVQQVIKTSLILEKCKHVVNMKTDITVQ